ncbi:MAG: hypothetical protein ACI9WU_004457 [Myxococcota bacterium]|jgi:hypothetical protein
MNSQVANAFAQRIIDNPVSQSFFERAIRIGFTDDAATAVLLTFSTDRSLGLSQHYSDDSALADLPLMMRFTPEALNSVAGFSDARDGGAASDPPEVTGSDEGLARQVLMVLGIADSTTPTGKNQSGRPGGSLELSREMVLDTQLGTERTVYSVFDARDPGPFDCRHWRVEAGVMAGGQHFAVSVGLTDPATPMRPPPSEQRTVTGAGHELVLLTGASGAEGSAHVGVMAMVLRQLAADDRPFKDPDWIDYGRPLWRGGSIEGFIITESRHLQSPYALSDGAWGRFYTLVGLTRDELDLLNTQKEPRRVLSILSNELGNAEITEPSRVPVNLW